MPDTDVAAIRTMYAARPRPTEAAGRIIFCPLAQFANVLLAVFGLLASVCASSLPATAQSLPPGCTNRTCKGSPLPQGYLSTNGNQIVDGHGNNVRLACVQDNEGSLSVAEFLAIRAAGFNCIRYSYWDQGYLQNAPGQGPSALDGIIANAKLADLRVIFDHHGNEYPPANGSACWGSQANGVPYDRNSDTPVNGITFDSTNDTDGCGVKGSITYAQYKAILVAIAQRYAGNPTLVALDLHNEPGMTGVGLTIRTNWGGNNGTDMRWIYNDAGSAINAVNPGVLLISEALGNYSGTLSNGTPFSKYPGVRGVADLSVAGKYPLNAVQGKQVYSIHDYPANISAQGLDLGAAMNSLRSTLWGYLIVNRIGPVILGETGCSCDNSNGALANDTAWAQTIVSYVNGRAGAQGGPTFTGTEQPMSAIWLMWGHLPGQNPNGTLNADGTLKIQQMQYWHAYLYAPTGGGQQEGGRGAPN